MKYVIKLDNGFYYGKINYADNTEYLTTKSDAKRFDSYLAAFSVKFDLINSGVVSSVHIEEIDE